MKNFKKLFIALPLVLVMIFMAVPVAAQPAVSTYNVFNDTIHANLSIVWPNKKHVTTEGFSGLPGYVPVWGAVQSAFALGPNGSTTAAGYYKVMNNGMPMTWVEANYDAITPFKLAQKVVNTDPAFADYAIPSYQINHVEKVDLQVRVPKNWIQGNRDVTYTVAQDTDMIFEAGHVIETKDPLTKINDSLWVYDANGKARQEVAVEMIEGEKPAPETHRLETSPATPAKYAAINFHDMVLPESTLEEIAAEALNHEYIELVKNADATYDLVYQGPAPETTYKLKENVYRYPRGYNVENVAEVYKDRKDPVYYADLTVTGGKVKQVVVDRGTLNETFEWATLSGLLVIVEETHVPVTIRHHYKVEGGEELVHESTGKQEKGVTLTKENIKFDWLKEVGEYKYDATQTLVETVTDNQELLIGESFVTGYVVDLFYVAAEGADADAIDAAFANTNAGVANANVANLPATGAASNVALILSSAALAVVGLFLKK